MSWEQFFYYAGIIITAIIGLLTYYDKRRPRMSLTPLESGQVSKTLNEAIELANKRALAAEEARDRLSQMMIEKEVSYEGKLREIESGYKTLKEEFELWKSDQNYQMVFNVTLGTTPTISDVAIMHVKDRRINNFPFSGEDRRK